MSCQDIHAKAIVGVPSKIPAMSDSELHVQLSSPARSSVSQRLRSLFPVLYHTSLSTVSNISSSAVIVYYIQELKYISCTQTLSLAYT